MIVMFIVYLELNEHAPRPGKFLPLYPSGRLWQAKKLGYRNLDDFARRFIIRKVVFDDDEGVIEDELVFDSAQPF